MSAEPSLADLGLQASTEIDLDADHALRLARTLDLPDDTLADGTGGAGTLPLTWIWVYFSPTAPTGGLRDDGHPRVAPDSPLAGLDRRMWVSGSIQREGDAALRLNETTTRHSSVVAAKEKQGGSGSFLLVELEHRYDQGGATILTEQQTVMYRGATAAPVPAPGDAVDPPDSAGPRLDVTPDERLLFRYSALTFNTHRIHYDLPYATGEEGYPGLVVHGPLTATLLAGLAETALGRPLRSFSFRATAPTFAGIGLHLVCDADRPESPPSDATDGGVEDGPARRVRAVRQDGQTVMTADARSV